MHESVFRRIFTTGDSIYEGSKCLVTTIRDQAKLNTDVKWMNDDDTRTSESIFSSTMDIVGIGYDPTDSRSILSLNVFELCNPTMKGGKPNDDQMQ